MAETPEEKKKRLQEEAKKRGESPVPQSVKDKQAEMDKKMREAAERFKTSSESDSPGYKRGGKIKKYAKGGSIRGGGCESKGKTRGRFV